jgi:hypothetical protein
MKPRDIERNAARTPAARRPAMTYNGTDRTSFVCDPLSVFVLLCPAVIQIDSLSRPGEIVIVAQIEINPMKMLLDQIRTQIFRTTHPERPE